MNSALINILLLLLTLVAGVAIYAIMYMFKKNKNVQKRYQTILSDLRKELSELRETVSKEVEKNDTVLNKLSEREKEIIQEKLKKEEYTSVAEKYENSVLFANVDGDLIWANKGFEHLYGYTLGEYKLHKEKNLNTIITNRAGGKILTNVIELKKEQSYINKIINKEGKEIILNTIIIPRYNNEGELSRFVVVDNDITDYYTETNQLKRLSLIVSRSSSVVLVYNKAKELDWVNEAFSRIYKHDNSNCQKVFGNTIEQYLDYHSQLDILKQVDEGKKELIFISPVEKEDGSFMWKQVRVMPYFDEFDISYIVSESDITRIKEVEQQLQHENEMTERLLLNILPEETAEELKTKGSATPMFYRNTSVLFADIIDFTKLAEKLTPVELVDVLQRFFLIFDDIAQNHFVEKIKTIGDAYLCVGGIPMRNKSHPFDVVLVGLEMQQMISQLGIIEEENGRTPWHFRIGIHSGPVVAGVVGKKKMTYDIWGDSVNIAKRMESACIPGKVNVSETTYEYIKDYFDCEHRGKILAKHKGHINMYAVNRLKPEFSDDISGIIPNVHFRKMLAQL